MLRTDLDLLVLLVLCAFALMQLCSQSGDQPLSTFKISLCIGHLHCTSAQLCSSHQFRSSHVSFIHQCCHLVGLEVLHCSVGTIMSAELQLCPWRALNSAFSSLLQTVEMPHLCGP